jgi:hypothetical protein
MPCCSRTSYSAIQYTPVACTATVSIRQDFSHSTISCRACVQQPNSRTGFSSRSGGTAAKWLSLPTSIPPALGFTIASCGSPAATRRPNSRRWARFIRPAFNRSKVDILRFAIPYSSSLISDPGSARLAKEMTDSPTGSTQPFSRPDRHQSMHRGSRSHAERRAQGTKTVSTITCRPGLLRLKPARTQKQSFRLNALRLSAVAS